MLDIYEQVTLAIRARHAILGGGIVKDMAENGRKQFTSYIPGANVKAIVSKDGSSLRGFIGKSVNTGVVADLSRPLDLYRFMYLWDNNLMWSGIGAAYFPLEALDFCDEILFHEPHPKPLSINPTFATPIGCRVTLPGEWTPSATLRSIANQYASSSSVSASARQAAKALLHFEIDGVGRPYDPALSKRKWMANVLKIMSTPGESYSGGIGRWSAIKSNAMTLALKLLSNQNDGQDLEASLSLAFGMHQSLRSSSGDKSYCLWKDGQLQALGMVALDGTRRTFSASIKAKEVDADFACVPLVSEAGAI